MSTQNVIEQKRLMCGPFQFVRRFDSEADIWVAPGGKDWSTMEIMILALRNQWETVVKTVVVIYAEAQRVNAMEEKSEYDRERKRLLERELLVIREELSNGM